MIYEVMRYCRNFFPADKGTYSKEWKISGGKIELPLPVGQYFCIEGSVFNDGVFAYNTSMPLKNETFEGIITPLKPPKAFLDLCDEIGEWCEKYNSPDSANLSPFQSESFDGYSYSKSGNAEGVSSSWQDVYKARLNEWRKR